MSRPNGAHLLAFHQILRRWAGEIRGALFIVAFNHGYYPSLRVTKRSYGRFDAIMRVKEGREPEWRGSIRVQADDLWLFLTWDPTSGILRPRTDKLDLPGRDLFGRG